MRNGNRIHKALLIAAMIAGVAGCSHGPVVQEFPETANTADEVRRLGDEINRGISLQDNVLAPRSFERAEASLNAAKKEQASGANSKKVLHSVAEGQAYLNQATEYSGVSKTNLEGVVAARQSAIDAGAPSLQPKEFQRADENLRDVTMDIEQGNLKSVTPNRDKLQSAYLDVELHAIQQASLGSARDMIALAEKEGAKDLASQSLAIAKQKVIDTDAYIVANRHEKTQVDARSADAKESAAHLLAITESAKAAKKTSPEQLALTLESREKKVESEKANVASKQAQLDEARRTNAALLGKATNMEADKAFDELYEKARAEFAGSEAEVYKQGDTLTIRLRGLQFPVLGSELKSTNYPLLSKVQKVIKSFGESTVSIEGHTDSVGDRFVNDRLSQQRADSVKKYFEANSPDAPQGITAKGFGFEKPIATNKTASGRAQNRRVDVLITPKRM